MGFNSHWSKVTQIVNRNGVLMTFLALEGVWKACKGEQGLTLGNHHRGVEIYPGEPLSALDGSGRDYRGVVE